MKRFFVLTALLALLASCNLLHTPSTSVKEPAMLSVAGAKGLFLQPASTSAHLAQYARSQGTARDVVTATGATLGAITSGGAPATATFLDSSGVTVTATVDQATQLTSNYELLTLTYSGTTATYALNISSAALVSIATVPDNWLWIWAQGSTMWAVTEGTVYKTDLNNGSSTAINASWTTWNVVNFGTVPQQSPVTVSGSSSWPSNSWVYADAAGNLYVMSASSTANFMAMCVPASGSAIDFANNIDSWHFYYSLPGQSMIHGSWIARATTGQLYLLTCINNFVTATNALSSYAVTLDPLQPGVLSIATTSTSSSTATLAAAASSMIGYKFGTDTAVWSDGPDTWKLNDAGQLTYYSTAAVPVDATKYGQNSVSNWNYSGGAIYSGPCAASNSINLVQFLSAPAVSDPPLVTDGGTTDWAVSGGTLFWTDSLGSWEAPIDLATGTIGTKFAYSGSIEAITQ